jgi:hypothetical protein
VICTAFSNTVKRNLREFQECALGGMGLVLINVNIEVVDDLYIELFREVPSSIEFTINLS